MSKSMRNAIIIVAIILLIFAIIFAIYANFKAKPIDANIASANILEDANTGLNNMLEQILDEEINNEEENEQQTNQTQTSESTNNANNKNVNNQETQETEDDNRMTPRETKAINLAKEEWKKEWGNTEDVSFSVSVQSDGKYGVTVYDTTTTQSIQFYIVDVDTQIVKER